MSFFSKINEHSTTSAVYCKIATYFMIMKGGLIDKLLEVLNNFVNCAMYSPKTIISTY